MELGPRVGRPKKDPEERRSELVHIRLCPSHRRIIEQEAERRDITMTIVIVRMAFEEMNPSERLIPRPVTWERILDEAERLYRIAEDESSSPDYRDLDPWDFWDMADKIKSRRENREQWWENAEDEKRNSRVGVRLKPRRLEWLEERALQKDTSRSSLLRVRAFQGIAKWNMMDDVEQVLRSWHQKSKELYERAKEGLPEETFREQLRKFAKDIFRTHPDGQPPAD